MLAALLVVLSGCGGPAPQTASSPTFTSPTPTPALCGDRDLGTVTFPTAGGGRLSGYVVGSGATGVVLGNQVDMSACGWLRYARELAGRGYRVLAFDFTGEGASSRGDAKPSADVAAAAAYLRQQGVAKVVLLGASRGATAVLIAGAAIAPPVTAVISLSAPATFRGEDAAAAVPKLSAPAVLYVAAERDGSFATDAQKLYAATPGNRRKLVIVPGGGHGAGFMVTVAEGGAEATAAVDAFLAANAAP